MAKALLGLKQKQRGNMMPG
jgi:hypothetical protein